MPAAVFVGERVAWPSKTFCQEPFCPRGLASVPQDNSPVELESMVSQDTRLSRVTAPEANNVPLSLVLPTTPRVVDGTAVPRPTLPSPPLTTRALRVSVELTVVVALILRVLSMVLDPYT